METYTVTWGTTQGLQTVRVKAMDTKRARLVAKRQLLTDGYILTTYCSVVCGYVKVSVERA